MQKRKVNFIERLEHSLVKVIQHPKQDQKQRGAMKLVLLVLKGISKIFHFVVEIRYLFYNTGVLRRFPLGCQVISIGNITAG
jgi:tetraacyldisaccharide-1-P 4'-kinase